MPVTAALLLVTAIAAGFIAHGTVTHLEARDALRHEHHDAGRETARHEGVADRADEVHTG